MKNIQPKIEKSLHTHILIFYQLKYYSCGIGVCEETIPKNQEECHSIMTKKINRVEKHVSNILKI